MLREKIMDSELSQQNWMPHMDNNHVYLQKPKIYCGGLVSFTYHLGKPLSQALWTDLIHRFVITHICVYKPDQAEWLMGWGSGHCTIRLDENDLVKDIEIGPHYPRMV